MIEIAITNLSPSAKWRLEGADYANIEWFSNDIQKPTKEELDAEIARLQAEALDNAYKAKRAAEYPSFAEQFDTLYHGGYDAWKATIDSVKAKYPKP